MELSSAIGALAALGQDHRLAIYRHLVRRGDDGSTVGEIRRAVGLAPATLSHHLSPLREAGLVRVEREGRAIRYRADASAIRALSAFLAEECCSDSEGCDGGIAVRAPLPQEEGT